LRPYAEYLLQRFAGSDVQVTSVYRSYSAQLKLWLTRSSNPYPVAPPGQSYHEYRRAFDVVGPTEVLDQMGALWERMGGTWGGRIGDRIHFQA